VTTAEQVLYTDREGEPAPLTEVISDGIEGGYEDRLPQLRELCEHGAPDHREDACQMLVAWSDPVGLRALTRWAEGDTGWVERPVDFPRLADALGTGKYTATPEVLDLRADAMRGLLAIADLLPFDERLRDALLGDNALIERVADDLRTAIERALRRLERRDRPKFDLATDTAALVVALARVDDEAAAAFAERLEQVDRRNTRLLQQLAAGMGQGRGPRTLASLERLRGHKDRQVRESADAALAVRNRR